LTGPVRALPVVTLLICLCGCRLPEASVTRGTGGTTTPGPAGSQNAPTDDSSADTQVWLAAANRQVQAGQLDSARATLVRLLKAHPDQAAAVELLAETARRLGDARLEQAALLRLLELHPGSATVQNRAGRQLLALTGNPASDLAATAPTVTTPGIPGGPGHSGTSRSSTVRSTGLEALRRAVELDPRTAGYVQDYASALLDENRHDEATQVLREAMERNPRDSELPVVAARLHEMSGNWSAALQAYDQALRNAPDNRLWHRQRGMCHYRLKNWDACSDDLRQALIGTPVRDQVPEFTAWGDACLRAQRFDLAVGVLDRLVQEGGLRTADTELQRGQVRWRLGERAAARDIIARASRDWPGHPGLRQFEQQLNAAADADSTVTAVTAALDSDAAPATAVRPVTAPAIPGMKTYLSGRSGDQAAVPPLRPAAEPGAASDQFQEMPEGRVTGIREGVINSQSPVAEF